MAEIDPLEVSEGAYNFLARRWGPREARHYQSESPVEFLARWREFNSLAWHSLYVPEDLGGLGFDERHLAALFEQVGSFLVPGLSLDNFLGAPFFLARGGHAAAEQLGRHLAGESIAIVAAQTVDGSDNFSPEPWDGLEFDGRSLSGERKLVSFAHLADTFVVTTCQVGVPVIVLCRVGPEVSLNRLPTIDVCDAPANIILDRAPIVDVIFRGSEALQLFADYMTVVRIVTAAEMLGLCRSLLNMSITYSQERVAFGKPIAAFQALRNLLAQMTTDIHGLSTIVKASARAVATGDLGAPAMAMSAKVHAARVGKRVSETALQIHGGIGFTDECDLHLYFKRSMTLQGIGGEDRALTRTRGRLALDDFHGSDPIIASAERASDNCTPTQGGMA